MKLSLSKLYLLVLTSAVTVMLYAQGPLTAVDYDGVDDYLYIPDNTSLQIGSNITLESWVKFSEDLTPFSGNYHQGLIDKGNYSLKI